MAHLYISAAHKSSGKTTLSVGLCRAFRDRGLRVQPFKKGPDFIDPLWLSRAAGRACYNLDFHTMGRGEIQSAFAAEMYGADLGLIEGNVGLYDSTDLAGANSNAALARHLRAPVVLVIDCQGMARGIAPLLLGYRAFDPDLQIGGVVLNKVASPRHAGNLVRAVEHYTDIPVLGVLQRDASLTIAERHLGLKPSNESEHAEAWIDRIARVVAEQTDLERLLELAERAPSPPLVDLAPPTPTAAAVRIGIARDAAFGFYYPDDLRALAKNGAELVEFSPLQDAEPPTVDGLFLGGGFPECRMRDLEANRPMREGIADFIARGRPVYAECGGLMYLCQTLRWGEDRRAMVGALKADVAMQAKPQGRGYVTLRETAACPWAEPDAPRREIQAHEFHHSNVVAPDPDWTYAYDVLRGIGIDGRHDGVVQGNLLASYAHLRDVGGLNWTGRFLTLVRRSLDG
ncbi:MAG TPA: cobyrinate a,c-diamide synthase [Lamprocystis sp. (in: g-proteobacteria)]|nr:cobyrinate a,c-diamide synthase [Lamprocystis sp. (in: g-proteobacteria)]